jgi:hypothetical protein
MRKRLNRFILFGLLLLLACPVWAENWQLVDEMYLEADPDLGYGASTVKTYVDMDSIEKNGSLREYWIKDVEYDHETKETYTTKVYYVFDCSRNQGAIKIYATGKVVPDNKLSWVPVCTGNEPPPANMFDALVIKCRPYYEHKFVCGQ